MDLRLTIPGNALYVSMAQLRARAIPAGVDARKDWRLPLVGRLVTLVPWSTRFSGRNYPTAEIGEPLPVLLAWPHESDPRSDEGESHVTTALRMGRIGAHWNWDASSRRYEGQPSYLSRDEIVRIGRATCDRDTHRLVRDIIAAMG